MHYVLFTGSPRAVPAISLLRQTTHGSRSPKGFASRQWWPPTWWPTLKPQQPPVSSTVWGAWRRLQFARTSTLCCCGANLLRLQDSMPHEVVDRAGAHSVFAWTHRFHAAVQQVVAFSRVVRVKFCCKCCLQRAMYRLALIALPLTSRARARCQRRSVSASSTRLMVPRMTEQQVDAQCDGSTLFWQRHDAAVSRARPYI